MKTYTQLKKELTEAGLMKHKEKPRSKKIKKVTNDNDWTTPTNAAT
tara:strand:+ start:816 stop:953 length:138 start_codon:yes stop_codon:yes gene_type:complete